ncbi:MAG: RsmB/NOP family class I SAM-dependent RNA methyltransferase [Candidatus Fervidibacter sp.]|uniref:RsmB/NOP family class I SAM-dependent RNA methyltransferase n=1 Tax=Candidatus Fervidibacter sp. TaxID=3100871 RepID=UPI0040499C2F
MERYREIIPDFDAFMATLEKPQPVTIRVNRLKATPEQVADSLKKRGFETKPTALSEWILQVEGEGSVAKTLEHWLGWFYVQEASAATAVMALEPNPGECILDLCASPGGKTTQMAELMNNMGLIVANDTTPKRLRALLANLSRLGVVNTIVTQWDGRNYPDLGIVFDKALVDAPCSSEGKAREEPELRQGADINFVHSISGTQKGLLRRALELVKPGGIVVYATCTFAPEENEAVVAYALQKVPCEPLPIDLPVPHSPGLTEWQGRVFGEEMKKCVRIYPHHIDSGGLFLAKLRKL